MRDLVVCAGATHRAGLLLDLEQGLHEDQIRFHLEPIGPMPNGPNSMSMRRKIGFVRAMAAAFPSYRRIVIADAWDVVYVEPADPWIHNIPETVLIAAERNCYPEPHLAASFQKPSPWRFANAGLMSGSPAALLEWCGQAEDRGELDILDQAWLNRRYTEGSPLTPLDWTTSIFYTVSRAEDGSMQMKHGPWNAVHDTRPVFFHFSGQTPTDAFRKMLETGEPLQ